MGQHDPSSSTAAGPPKEPRGTRAEAMPPGTPDWVTMDLVRETVRVWQPYYSEPISFDGAVTILTRVGRLFAVLSER
jgi:hypothetical protein